MVALLIFSIINNESTSVYLTDCFPTYFAKVFHIRPSRHMRPLQLEDPQLGFQHLLALLHRADVEVEVVLVHVNWKRAAFRSQARPRKISRTPTFSIAAAGPAGGTRSGR